MKCHLLWSSLLLVSLCPSRRTADVALLHPEVEVPAKCLQEEMYASPEKTPMKDRKSPEYENLVTAMESQYETEGIL